MDTTMIQAVTEQTAATQSLVGTLWVFMGFVSAFVCGVIGIKYTFKGR